MAGLIQNIGKYLSAENIKNQNGGSSRIWRIRNRGGGDELGLVTYYPRWRQWVFDPEYSTTYSAGCLREIADFLDRIKQEESPVKPCQHKRVEFLGLQIVPGGPPLKLYNCLDCKSTITKPQKQGRDNENVAWSSPI